MTSPAIRWFPVALALVVLAACHSSGGDDPPADTNAPSTPAGVVAAATGPTTVNVTWNAATDSGGSGIKDYIVYRGGVAVAFVATTSFADAGLTASTLYSYQIAARDDANNESSRSAAVNVTTLAAPDTTPPSVPSGLTATATSATTVNVSWTGATDPGGSGVKDYTVYRDGVAVAAVTTTSFVDAGLTANTLYSYQISARDNNDNASNRSPVVTATTLATPDATPPSVPTGLTATATSATTVNVSWGAATDGGGSGLKDYIVYRDGAAVATVATTSFDDSGLTASTLYAYEVSARDNALNTSARSVARNVTTPATSDTTPPSVTGLLMTRAVSSTQVDLTWGAASDNVGVVGYGVERCAGAGCTSFAQIATATRTSFSDMGLAASTSYSYRVRAADVAGNTGPFSNTSSTTTQDEADTTPPSAPGALTASAVSFTQINLSWSAATDDVGVTGYRVERCSGAGCSTFTQIATPTGTTFNDTGLTASTSYSYRVRAVDAALNPGAYSNTSDATTVAAPDTTPPSAPALLTASPVSSTQINLSWGAATDDVGVTFYRVERCVGAGCTTFAQFATPTGTTFSNVGLTASTSYSYRVLAVDAADNSGAYSNTSSAMTQAAPDTTPPSAPGALTSNAVSDAQINLSWSAATDDVGVTGYRVERCSGVGCTTFAQIATPTGTTYNDMGLTASTSYSYRVLAVDAADNSGAYSNTSSATTQAAPDTTPPSAPGTLTAIASSPTGIDLTWGAATDDVGVTSYRVERCSGVGCTTFAQIATPTGTTYNDMGLTASTSYSYRVLAVDAADNSGAYSNTSSATTQAAPDTTPPSAPGMLTAIASSPTGIDLTWGAATDDVGVTGYRVERCSELSCPTFTQIATATGTTFNDTGLTASTSYSYRVQAVDAAANSGAFSNTGTATTQTGPDTTPPGAPGALTASAVSATQIDLNWGEATDDVGVVGYRVERCSGVSCTPFAQIATPTDTSFSDSGLTDSTSYSYHVRAVDAAGNLGPLSNTGTATTEDATPPGAPGALTASAVSATEIDLSWGVATDNVGVTGYRVERCTGAGCTTFTQVATPTATSFNDTGLADSTSYSYRVRAVDAAGNLGPLSNTDTATTEDATPPSAPGDLTATPVSATGINLSWGAVTDNVGVAGYRVERCSGAGCTSFTQIATPTGVTFGDTGLTDSTSYSYRVHAVDAAGNAGPFSGTSSATTLDATPPSAPGTLTSSAVSDTQINLSWGAATDNVGVTGYSVERCSGAGCASFTQVATPMGTTYNDTGLTAAASYSYRVRAVDAANNLGAYSNESSTTTQESPDTTPPSAPGTLTSSAVSSSQINLGWGTATDDVGVTGYRVERCTGAGCGDFAQIATPASASFSDTGLTVSTSYSYRVRAVDAAGNPGAFSNTSSATTPDTSPPSAPGTLMSSATSASQIDLSWDAATDDVGVTAYRVERCAGAGCVDFAQIATPTGTSFGETGLTASTSYSYRVRAVDAAGNAGPFSNTSSAITSDTTPPSAPGTLTSNAVSSTQVDLSWGAATDDVSVSGYRVERCTGASCVDFAEIASPTGTSFSNTGLTPSTSYSYRVRAVDAAANPGAYANTSSVTTPTEITGLDTRPTNLSCVAPPRTVGSSTITLTTVINGGPLHPVAAVQAPGDNSRWFVVERFGRILAFSVGNPTPSVFLDIRSAIRDPDQEAGLLGLAFHPDFASNGKLYVFYTGAPSNGSYLIQSRIAEFTSADRTTVMASTERVLLRADKAYGYHNGGQLAFGPDGLLYASLGDGGASDDSRNNGQSLLTLFGKIIRIDVDGTTGETQYAIPPGNTYAGNATCPLVASGVDDADTSRSAAECPEIYASGLRNPWRFSLDRGSAAPDLWVGDVGENQYEEINRVTLGGNYGWDVREGPICHEPTSGCASAGLTDPIVVGPHSSGMFSIIGGFVYRGSAIPSLQGRYLFTDFFESGIHTYDGAATNGYTTLLANSGVTVSAFAEGNDGELYLVDFSGGRLLRIDPGSGANTSPVPSLLSETGCVVPGNPTQPASGLIPYAPSAPFWSDAASKDRWLAMPDGTVASVGADGDWLLPPGTVLMKNFRLQSQLIETRLLMRHPDGEWAGYTYQWNAAQTEAERVVGGAVVPLGTPSQNWIYPSEAQCVQCHTGAAGRSLGLENGQLNHPILYPQTGRTANQITTLAHVGILPASMPDAGTLPVLPDPHGSAPLAQRARAYLHTNCSFCHRPGGGAPGAMDLRYDTPISATNVCNVTPTRGDLGVPGANLITPANPAASVLYLRMSRRDADKMPPIGSNLVDTDGAALLEQWILQMSGTCN